MRSTTGRVFAGNDQREWQRTEVRLMICRWCEFDGYLNTNIHKIYTINLSTKHISQMDSCGRNLDIFCIQNIFKFMSLSRTKASFP